ncbi:large-conductance mechanosensitive channel protein MscL [soil metagenome]
MLQEFKKFLLRGNVIDLAVAVVIGAAFKAVIDSLVKNILMPIIGIIGGEPSFDAYKITINDSQIRWGTFVTAVVSFVIIAAALFVAIKSFEKLQNLRKTAADVDDGPEPLTVSEELLAEIRDLMAAQGGATPPAPHA